MKKRAARQVKPRETAAGSPIDEYVAQAPPATRPILQKIRAIVRQEARGAVERISYRMPAFFDGWAIIYFAPFRHHVGIFRNLSYQQDISAFDIAVGSACHCSPISRAPCAAEFLASCYRRRKACDDESHRIRRDEIEGREGIVTESPKRAPRQKKAS